MNLLPVIFLEDGNFGRIILSGCAHDDIPPQKIALLYASTTSLRAYSVVPHVFGHEYVMGHDDSRASGQWG
jgi:hypothetical protein